MVKRQATFRVAVTIPFLLPSVARQGPPSYWLADLGEVTYLGLY